MKIKKYFPISVPNINGNEGKYLQECVDTEYVSSVGNFVSLFEEKLAKHACSKFCIAVNSGTSALHAALLCSGVGKDDIVLTSNYSFVASANAILYAQATPIFFDIEGESLNADLELIENYLENECSFDGATITEKASRKRIGAILLIFALGNPIDSKKIDSIKRKWKLPIIIDGAAAIGAKSNNLELGKLDVDYITLSFNGNKTITCGGGGAMLTNKFKNYEVAKHITTTARDGENYYHDQLGFNYRLTNVHATIGLAQLEKIDLFLERKRQIFKNYKEELLKYNFLSFYEEPSWSKSSLWLSYFLCSDLKIDLQKIFKQKNLSVRKFWMPLSSLGHLKNFRVVRDHLSKSISEKLYVLPSSTNLSDSDQSMIIDTIKHIFDNLK